MTKKRKQLKSLHKHDNYCQICELLIPINFEPNAPDAPSLDHITPKSKRRGIPFNRQIAHRYCNSRRGHLPIEQLQDKLTKEAYRRGLDSAIRQWEEKNEKR